MKNSTILSLCIFSLVNSPSFYFPENRNFFSHSISKSYISKSFNSFLRINSFLGSKYSISIDKSSFNYFLSSAINTHGSNNKITELAIEKPLKLHDSEVSVTHCTFSNCFSGSNGGALRLSAFTKKATVNYCIFSNCTSQKDGGAMYSESPRLWGYYCCFMNCGSGNESIGGSLSSITDGVTSLMFYSFFNSPLNYPEPKSNGVAYVNGGTQSFTNNNFTANHGTICSSIILENPNSTEISNINIFDQISACAIAFINLPEAHQVSNGNIINGSYLYGIFRLDYSKALIESFIFLSNNASLTATFTQKSSSSGLYLRRCIFDMKENDLSDGEVTVIKDICLFGREQRTPLYMIMVNTWGCEGNTFTDSYQYFFGKLFVIFVIFVMIGLYFSRQERNPIKNKES